MGGRALRAAPSSCGGVSPVINHGSLRASRSRAPPRIRIPAALRAAPSSCGGVSPVINHGPLRASRSRTPPPHSDSRGASRRSILMRGRFTRDKPRIASRFALPRSSPAFGFPQRFAPLHPHAGAFRNAKTGPLTRLRVWRTCFCVPKLVYHIIPG